MLIAVIVLSFFLVLSLSFNVFTFLKLKSVRTERPKSVELREFVTDLFRGDALLRVSRVDPADVLLRSPRGQL